MDCKTKFPAAVASKNDDIDGNNDKTIDGNLKNSSETKPKQRKIDDKMTHVTSKHDSGDGDSGTTTNDDSVATVFVGCSRLRRRGHCCLLVLLSVVLYVAVAVVTASASISSHSGVLM